MYVSTPSLYWRHKSKSKHMLLFFPPQPIIYFVFVIVFFSFQKFLYHHYKVATKLEIRKLWEIRVTVKEIRKKLGNFTKFFEKLKFLTLKKFKGNITFIVRQRMWSIWHYKCFEIFDWPLGRKNFTNWPIKKCSKHL